MDKAGSAVKDGKAKFEPSAQIAIFHPSENPANEESNTCSSGSLAACQKATITKRKCPLTLASEKKTGTRKQTTEGFSSEGDTEEE